MESSWRFNVWYTGWAGSALKYIARKRGQANAYYGWQEFFDGEGIIWELEHVPGQVPALAFYQLTTFGFRFPGSLFVEPDNVFP